MPSQSFALVIHSILVSHLSLLVHNYSFLSSHHSYTPVEDPVTHRVLHYVEKPSTFVSSLINCGVYVCSIRLLSVIGKLGGR